MSDQKSFSETNNQVSDEIESKKQETKTQEEKQQEDKVAYETYRRVLSEKKKMQERLEQLEKLAREREEAELKEKEKWQEYAKLKEKEALEIKQKYDEEIKAKTDMIKMSSFLDAIDGVVPREYWSLIDLEKIVVDPATNMPDPLSVQQAAKEFQTKYYKVIEKKPVAKTPNDAPKAGGTLSYEDWLKLPLAEMKKRQKEVVN